VVLIMHEQNFICSQTKKDDIVHKQTIICRQLFAGHVVRFRPIKRKNNLHRMIINVTSSLLGHSINVLFEEEYTAHS